MAIGYRVAILYCGINCSQITCMCLPYKSQVKYPHINYKEIPGLFVPYMTSKKSLVPS